MLNCGWSDFYFFVQIQIYCAPAHAFQSFHFQKNPGDLIINIFFVKISIKIPFTLKNKRNFFGNLSFKSY